MRFKTVAAVSALFVLTGCFEMQQDIVVSDDGTAKLHMVTSVDAALIGMASQGKPDNFCGEISGDKLPLGLIGSAKRSTEKGDVVCTITVEGPTERVLAAFSNGNLLGDSQNESKDLAMRLTVQGDSKRLDLAIPPLPRKRGEDEEMQAMIVGATSGRVLE